MKIAIMQPYFFPYIGYFQLMQAVDEFVIYDNIQYTKKGWISRNRILVNGKDEYISLTLKKDSDYLDVKDRFLADTWSKDCQKMFNRIKESYRKAPQFSTIFPMVEKCLSFEENNLFLFILNSVQEVKNYLDINTPLVRSSQILVNHDLKAEQKVMAICKARNANHYINPIGGLELYSGEQFKAEGLQLNFLKTNSFQYSQLGNEFVPFLSILDVLMFNEKEKVKEWLRNEYQMIEPK